MQPSPLASAVQQAVQEISEINRTQMWVDFFIKAYGRLPYDEAELRTFAAGVAGA